MKHVIVVIYTSIVVFHIEAQKDSTDISFTGTKLDPYEDHDDSTGHFSYSGYIDTYFAYYSDTNNSEGFVKFPTGSPRNKEFGLNMILLNATYQAEHIRGIATLFYGDIARSAWSSYLNMVQEANVGIRIRKGLWVDLGYFRTHFGLESIQPRENPTVSFATTTYYEPYFLSGAKLTYSMNDHWTLQAGVFNGYNTFIETNNNKALTLSSQFVPNSKQSHTLNLMTTDESLTKDKQRIYINYIGILKSRRNSLGIDLNFGAQQNSQLSDTSKTAFFYSALAVYKHRFTPTFASYLRYEFFSDLQEILTGPVLNVNHTLIGLQVNGATLGIEFKPVSHSFIRLESRYLHLANDEKIFFYQNKSTNQRFEVILSAGIWF